MAAQYADITAIALSLPSEEAGRGVEASRRLGEECEQTNGRGQRVIEAREWRCAGRSSLLGSRGSSGRSVPI